MKELYHEIVDEVWQLGKEKVLESGSFQMTYFIYARGNLEILTVPEFVIDNKKAKTIVGHAVSQIAHKIKAEMVIVMSEAWTLKIDYDEAGNYDRSIVPGESDDRMEKLILTALTADGENIMKTGSIIRNDFDPSLAGVVDDPDSKLNKQSDNRLVQPWDVGV